MKDNYTFEELVEIMSKLRGPSGCPWDKEQTHRSLKRHLIEEAYETIEAIDREDFTHLKEELGDLLLQIVFHAQIASEEEKFTIEDVLEDIVSKLIRRHPHIFADVKVTSSREVIAHWEEIKEKESEKESLLADIPRSLPALLYALKLQGKAALVGFDWTRKEDIINKLEEEVGELKAALAGKGDLEDEMGDLLFTVVNVARHLDIDPESALRRVANKFRRRFEHMEKEVRIKDKNLKDFSLREQDELWEEAKKKLEK
ncbi:MAG: nucleoside triphosphate pyrophosphohydrolase [Actinomycetota bacterium]